MQQIEKFDAALKAMRGLIDAVESKDDIYGKALIFYFLSIFHDVGMEVVETFGGEDDTKGQGMFGHQFNKIISKHMRLTADNIDKTCEENSH